MVIIPSLRTVLPLTVAARSRRWLVLIACAAVGASSLSVLDAPSSGAAPRVVAAAAAADQCLPDERTGIVFVIDDSGSMSSNDPDELRATATEIGIQSLPKGSYVDVVAFDDGATVVVPPTELTSPGVRDSAAAAVRSALTSGGGTSYGAAFGAASTELSRLPASVTRRAVVFLSDGEPGDSNSNPDPHLPIASQGIPIHTIGFGAVSNDTLQQIADDSGGTAQKVDTASETQAAVGSIVASVTCDDQVGNTVIDLPAGGSASYPFTIPDDYSQFNALVTWPTPGVRVRLRRPDTTWLTDASQRGGETFESGDTYARATSDTPEAGVWRVVLSSTARNPVTIDVRIFAQEEPTRDPNDPPTTSPACRAKGGKAVRTLNGREVWAGCLVPEGTGYRATGTTRVSGLVIAPDDSILLRGDGRVEGRGRVGFELNTPVYRGIVTVPMDLSVLRTNKGFDIPAKIGDQVMKKIVPLKVRDQAGFALRWDTEGLMVKLSLGIPGTTIQPVSSASTPLRSGAGFGFGVTIKASNAEGLRIDELALKLPKVKIWNKLVVEDLALTYRFATGIFGGGGTITLPGATPLAEGPEIAVDLKVDVPSLIAGNVKVEVKIEVAQINKPIFGPLPIFLQKIGGKFSNLDGLELEGSVGITLGPSFTIPGSTKKVSLVGADGTVKLKWDDISLDVNGAVKLLESIQLASANLYVHVKDKSAGLSGEIDIKATGFPGEDPRLYGRLAGDIDLSGSSPWYRLTGKLDAVLPVVGGQKAETLATPKGLGFCATKSFNIGVGPWQTTITKSIGGALKYDDLVGGLWNIAKSALTGCDFARISGNLGRVIARTARVPGHQGQLQLLYVPATTSAVTFDVPGAGIVSVPAQRDSHVDEGPVIADRLGNGEILALVLPSEDGSVVVRDGTGAQVRGVLASRSLESPEKLSARLAPADGGRWTLSYRLDGIEEGDTVQLVARGRHAEAQVLGEDAGARGSVTFRPSYGSGERVVQAIVTRGADLREVIPLGAFTARVTAPKIGRIVLKRRGVIAWTAPRHGTVATYQIAVRLADGRRIEVVRTGSRLKLAKLPRHFRARVTVTTLFEDGTRSVRSARVRR